MSNSSDQPLNQSIRVSADILDPIGIAVPGSVPASAAEIPLSIEGHGTAILRVAVTVPSTGAFTPGAAFPISFMSESGRIVLATLLQVADPLAAQLAIVDVAFSEAGEHALVLQIVSPPARRVRLERSLDLKVWESEACTLPPGSGQRFESFIGNGLPIDCEVPCDVGDPRVFYRAVLLEP